MSNTVTHFECQIEDLYYSTIERKIAKYFDMGVPSSSEFPQILEEDIADTYTLSCSKKSGKFYVSTYKLKDGTFQLSVTLQGRLYKC